MTALPQDLSQIKGDFYDGLYLHSLLQSDASRRIKSGERQLPRSSATSVRGDLQLLLDDLALLCDSESGGSTTTAIAVEQRINGNVFWVASNKSPGANVTAHLSGLINTLEHGIHQSGTDEHNTRQIVRLCVKRSPQRVENYVGRLSSAVRSMPADSWSNGDGRYRETRWMSF